MADRLSMNGASFDYDLIAIGSGPGGQRAAIQAAKLGKRVAVVERTSGVGGVCVRTGTIPSKTLREAAMALTGYRDRGFYGSSYSAKQHIGMEDLVFRADQVVRNETDVVRHQLLRNDIDIYNGHGSFIDPHTIVIDDADGHGRQTISGAHLVLATGTTATRDETVEFDGRRILTSDHAVTLDRLPRTLVVIGAGVIGLEYASMFSALGVRVTLVRQAPAPALVHGLRDHGRAGLPHAAWPHDALARGGGQRPRPRRRARRRRPRPPGQRQAHRGREGLLLDRPHRGHGEPEPAGRRHRGRRARAADRGRALPHRGTAHLRRRRRDRLPQPRLDLARAGSPGGLPRLRRRRAQRALAGALRRSTRSPRSPPWGAPRRR